MWRLFNCLVAVVRLCIGLVCFLTGNWVAFAYGTTELVSASLAFLNGWTARRGDWSLAGLFVPMIYTFSYCLVPCSSSASAALVLLEMALAGALLSCEMWLGLNYSCGVPTWRAIRDSGPYSIVRHPQAVLSMAIRVVFILANQCWWNFGAGAMLTVGSVFIVLREERFLLQFADWRSYARRVRWRLVPGVW